MQIVMTLDTFRSTDGGPPRSVSALARALDELNLPVEVWTLERGPSLDGLSVRQFASTRHLTSELATLQPQNTVVHDNGLWRPFNLQVCRTAKSAALPYLISTRGMLEPWCLNRSKWKKYLAWHLYQRKILEGASALHATSTQEASGLRALGLRAPIIVQPNGVELPKPSPHRASSQTALFLSRIDKKKGLEMLLDAWSSIRPVNWRLRIAGSGESEYLSRLQQRSRELQINDSVDWLGELDDSRKWQSYADSEFFVLPSYSENFGLAVVEALASGIPVLTTTATPWADLDAKGCGLCVAPETKSIASALIKLISMPPDERRRFGANGREWVEKAFSWRTIAAAFVDCYRRIIARYQIPVPV